MIPLKTIGVIGALIVGVLVVSTVVTGASTVQKAPPLGGVGGVGSTVGGAKGDIYYNFPAPVFPEMPVYEMPEALVKEVVNETKTAPSKKQVFSQKLGESTYPITFADKVYRDLVSIRETGSPVGSKKEAVSQKPIGWGAYAPSTQPTQPTDSSTKKDAKKLEFEKLVSGWGFK